MIDKVSEVLHYDDIDDLQNLARILNRVIDRYIAGTVTLTGTSTVISDSLINTGSLVFLTPVDETAQTTNVYVTVAQNVATIVHDGLGTFNYLILV